MFLFVGSFAHLEKEPKDFSSSVFSSGLLVVHNATWGCQNNVSAENKKDKKHDQTMQEGAALWMHFTLGGCFKRQLWTS